MRKSFIEANTKLSEKDTTDLSSSIREYNEYMLSQINKIFEFDIWYEHTKNKEFPKEWYSKIRRSEAHK
jgi:hypothetical protein